MKSLLTAAVALSSASAVYALNQQCVSSDLCYSLSIPDSTASSGSGDVYFQISASTSYSWAALGEGSGMIGANIFVMYTSSDGQNVTVSPRYATGYSEPQHDTDAQITLLEGSGVVNGKMVANIRCSNCQSWSTGSESWSASTGNFIYAALSGSPINSDSLTATISEHDERNAFTWDLSSAKGGSANTNPFVAASPSKGGSSVSSVSTGSTGSQSPTGSATSHGSVSTIPSTCTPIADSAGSGTPSSTLAGPSGSGCPTTWPASFSTAWPTSSPPAWVQSCYPDGPWNHHHTKRAIATAPPLVPAQPVKRDSSCPPGYSSDGSSNIGSITQNGASATPQQHLILAHAVLACLAFVALFPAGGILIRIANFPGAIWVHAAIQAIGYLVYLVAFGLGVYLATTLHYLDKAHPVIGIVLFAVLFFQPILGVLHHRMYKKYSHRTLWSYLHLFQGRIAILLGMVNGGLGIWLANTASLGGRIAYAVIAACMGLSYIIIVVIGERRRRRKTSSSNYEKNQRSHRLRDLSSSESDMATHRNYGVSSDAQPPPPPAEYYGRKF